MDVGHCNLDGNADAVEFCRHESYYNVLAASTYVLQEGDHPSRSGSITLFDVDANVGRLELIHKVETAGIFYLKWSSGNHPLLAQADADGYVKVYSLQYSDSESAKLNGDCLNEDYGTCISSSMCLCMDWNSPATSLAVGLSDGSVSIVSLDESQLNILQEWKAHGFELWAAAFDIQQPMLVYTGSDDCKFSCWDLHEDPSQLVFQNTKAHKMGVCCIAKSPHDPNILLAGSYDEYLRIWDVRSTSMPVSESSIRLGGGVWRIKHHLHIPGLVLTACMHNRFAIVKFEGDQVEVVESYKKLLMPPLINQVPLISKKKKKTYRKHGSLAYGADWQRGDSFVAGGKKSSAVATCSFYDQLLRVWTPERPGCSSIAYGLAKEIGPFHIEKDGKSLYLNPYSWNKVANILFVDSPVGVGYSYSKTSSDLLSNGDKRTAADSLKFLHNWFERFPQYKGRDFYLSGESYAGYYVPQLSHAILKHNQKNREETINLKGFVVGNALTDDFHDHFGVFQFMWSVGMISDQTYKQLNSHCDFQSFVHTSEACIKVLEIADQEIGDIDLYSIYTPPCTANFSRLNHLWRRKSASVYIFDILLYF